jgi:hypothetical protein
VREIRALTQTEIILYVFRSYFGSGLGGEGSFLSAGFLGRMLAAVAGFGSFRPRLRAGCSLPTALAEQVARWASIPEDCQ